jgi:hypothetical protein
MSTGKPLARRLGELVKPAQDDPNELIKDRFLCAGQGALLVGATGIGKSTFAMQCAIAWAVERATCGLVPKRPLKSLFIQAEDDDGDLVEMRDGIIKGMGLTAEEAERAKNNVLVCHESGKTGGVFCLAVVGPLLREHRPDVLWINPALAYLGGDSSDQKVVGAFLRIQLDPLLHEFNCAGIIVAHSAKPPRNGDRTTWTGLDYAYLALGSVEWANWARAVIVILGTTLPGNFELRVPKRGKRLKWRMLDGKTPVDYTTIEHSTEGLYWKEVPRDVAAIGMGHSPKATVFADALLALVPKDGSIAKSVLLNQAQVAGIGLNKARGFIAELLDGRKLHEWHIKRPGTRPEVRLGRKPQPASQNEPESQPATVKPSLVSVTSATSPGAPVPLEHPTKPAPASPTEAANQPPCPSPVQPVPPERPAMPAPALPAAVPVQPVTVPPAPGIPAAA